jgi:predicted nucleic acid-binding protein
VVTSELSVLEVLVKPLKINDVLLADLFRRVLYDTLGLTALPISREVLELSAQLRAAHGLKTPDAIHAATALHHGCSEFVTNDAVFKRVPGLPVIVLNERAAAP